MGDLDQRRPIGIYEYLDYEDLSAVFRPYDPRSPAVASDVAALIEGRMPDARLEHVGSSAIPGCAGKGIIDLLLLYRPGRLSAARDAVDGLGFQRQAGADPFPEERPLRVGSYDYDGTSYKLHVHIVAENDPEARELIYFRDRVASDPALIDEYVESKRQSLTAIRGGTVDIAHNIAYNDGKGPFIRRILAEMEQDPATGEPQAR